MTPAQILNRAYTMIRNVVNSEPVKTGLMVKDELPLCTLKRMRNDTSDFGTTPHVPVQYQDNAGNYHFGWVPLHVWDTMIKPMIGGKGE